MNHMYKEHEKNYAKRTGDRESLKNSQRRKDSMCKGTRIRIRSDFSLETIQVRRQWSNSFNTDSLTIFKEYL